MKMRNRSVGVGGLGVRAWACGAEALERRVMLSAAVAAFMPQVTIATGGFTFGVVAGDVNRDGKIDLVYSNPNPGQARVGVLLGNGDGTFQTAMTFAAGSGARGLALSDVNGDGRLDVVVPNANDGNIGILLGNGDGTFGPQWTVATGRIPFWVTVADVNGDGKPDLLSAGKRVDNNLSVMPGNGDGTFGAAGTFALGSMPGMVAVGDFNRDGKIDVAVDNDFSDNVGVLLGVGDGTFASQVTVAAPGVSSVAAGDMNGDGKLDLVMGLGNNVVGVALGNGNGTFGAAATFPAPGGEFYSVALADMNGDGKLDAVVTDWGVGAVGVILGNGDGTLGAQEQLPVGPWPQGLAVADLNGDGRPDVVTADYVGNSLSVVLADPPPRVLSIDRSGAGPVTSFSNLWFKVRFSEPVTGVDGSDFVFAPGGLTASGPIQVTGGPKEYLVAVSGVVGTGPLGLNLVDNRTIVDSAGQHLWGNDLSYLPAMSFAVGTSPMATVLSDVNGDGKPDLMVDNWDPYFSGSIGLLLGNGDGTFGPQRTFAAGRSPAGLAVGDVDGNGTADVVAVNINSDTLSILLGNGDGSFQAQRTLETGVRPRSIVTADMNGDGKLDLLVESDITPGNVAVYLGNGDANFRPAFTCATGSGLGVMRVADVNGDGDLDLVIDNYFDRTLGVLLGNGDGTFGAQTTFATGPGPVSMAVSDVNGDGKVDLALTYANPGKLAVMMGSGDGTFVAKWTLALDPFMESVVVSDLNGDGKADLAVSGAGTDWVIGVLEGDGSGVFRMRGTFLAPPNAYGVIAGDVNGDGRADLVETSRGIGMSGDGSANVLVGDGRGSFRGEVYQVTLPTDTITGTGGNDVIVLRRNLDGVEIDCSMGAVSYVTLASDAYGLTINGNGGTDTITLDYTNGNPLPDTLHLNGTFTIQGLSGTNPLSGTRMDVNRSTVFISYGAGSPLAAMRQALAAGYDGGTWNGSSPNGAIISAAANFSGNTAVGWADSADGTGVNTTPNTIELKYTLYGDTNLNGVVDIFDLNNLLPHYNHGGDWTGGDFTYSGNVDILDLNAMLPNYNKSLGSEVSAAVAPARAPVATTAEAVNGGTVSGAVPGGTGLAGDGADAGSIGRRRKGRGRWRG